MSTEGAAEWRASHDARKNQLADEQRQAQEALLSNQVSSGAINPTQYGQGINDLYAHEPAESRLGRIGRGLERTVGLKKQANAQQQVADANLAAQPSPRRNLENIEAQAKTPQQLAMQNATNDANAQVAGSEAMYNAYNRLAQGKTPEEQSR